MRVEFNAYFRAHPSTGSGQYLHHLAVGLTGGFPDLQIIERRPPARLRGNAGKVLWEQAAWPLASRGAEPAVRHVPYLAPPLLSAQTVVTAHDAIPFILPAYRAGLPQRLYGLVVRLGLRRTRIVIADSHATAADLIHNLGVPAGRVRVVHLGVDGRFRPELQNASRRVRADYALPDRFALYLGSLDARKNLGVLLRTWPHVWAETAVGLVVAGRSPARSSRVFVDWFLGLDADAAPWLRVLGPVAERDKPGLYHAASLFVFPSRYEGFGLEPLEAMACGVPVLAADASSLPEVVGDAGVLIAPDDATGWQTTATRILSDAALAQRLRAQGIARAAEFGWDRTAAATHRVYLEAAS